MNQTLKARDVYQKVRENCAYRLMDDYRLFRIDGKDTFDYLQTQTTNDILALQPGQGQDSAIVDRKGKLIATFSFHRDGDAVWVLTESSQIERLRVISKSFYFGKTSTYTPPMHTNS